MGAHLQLRCTAVASGRGEAGQSAAAAAAAAAETAPATRRPWPEPAAAPAGCTRAPLRSRGSVLHKWCMAYLGASHAGTDSLLAIHLES